MKHVKKIMFVVMASLLTMSLFSFRSPSTNEEALKKVTTTYASYSNTGPVQDRWWNVIQKVAKVVVVVTAVVIGDVQENESAANDITAKSTALLANL